MQKNISEWKLDKQTQRLWQREREEPRDAAAARAEEAQSPE